MLEMKRQARVRCASMPLLYMVFISSSQRQYAMPYAACRHAACAPIFATGVLPEDEKEKCHKSSVDEREERRCEEI